MTSYLYENLLPERFQHFCQALLLTEFPDLQCFPVGQPDGGRDGAAFNDNPTVIQVKFKRIDETVDDTSAWMIAALEGEKTKIQRLVERGARAYRMVTNARGTAHLDVGSIDKVQAWLDEHVTIPSRVYWRDDLDRRVEATPLGVKWNYSAILTGTDGIQLAVSSLFAAAEQDRYQALKAFIATQFERDAELKFKQVSLSNHLLDLFVDSPLKLDRVALGISDQAQILAFQQEALPLARRVRNSKVKYLSVQGSSGQRWRVNPWNAIGAAHYFLSDVAHRYTPNAIIHGAPGQGKSTLAQFVCQVQRARFLDKKDFLSRVDKRLQEGPFRVPFKLDLRDFSQFLQGRDPYTEADENLAQGTALTLEGFLAHTVQSNSGGMGFTVQDLVKVLVTAPALLFFDGLDEVADVGERQRLLDTIAESLNRLTELGADLQTCITTRPTIFGKAPSHKRGGFIALELADIDIKTISEYAHKWTRTKALDELEIKDLLKILESKLALAHIADLTKNPMQLTILLTLIDSVGPSLPDERTDLYGRYLELFLNREAEKSRAVLRHRRLLVSVVQYLAWTLQTQAETRGTSGSIREQDLRTLVEDYLAKTGQSNDLLEELFSQGLERIFILVQRIEGHYEFEVQPLREYFCARFLYETAPVGTYRRADLSGDRAQRLEALIQNPFWLNVARFYAGSYEKGEIASILTSIKEIAESDSLARAAQARLVGAALLSDWVFREKPFAQQELVSVVFDDLGLSLASSGLLSASSRSVAALPAGAGREALGSLLVERYSSDIDSPGLARLDTLFRINGGQELACALAPLVGEVSGAARTRRLARLLATGGTDVLSGEEFVALVTGDEPSQDQVVERLRVMSWSASHRIESLEPIYRSALELTLSGHLRDGVRGTSPLARLSKILLGDAELLQSVLTFKEPSDDDDTSASSPENPSLGALFEELSSYVQPVSGQHDPWTLTEPWDAVTAAVERAFGPGWANYRLAVEAAAVVGGKSRGKGAADLFDSIMPASTRARYARFNRRDLYWKETFEQTSSSEQRMFWSTLFLQWSSASAFELYADLLESAVDQMTDDEYNRVLSVVDQFAHAPFVRRAADLRRISNVGSLSPRVARFVVSGEDGALSAQLTVDQRKFPATELLLELRATWATLNAHKDWAQVSPEERPRLLELQDSWFRRSAEFADPRLAGASLPPDLQEIVHQNPLGWALQTVHTAVQSATVGYQPDKVEQLAIDQGWTFL